MEYIGQTGPNLQYRVKKKKQHQSALKLMNTNLSAVAQHAIDKDHEINWENAKVVDNQKDLNKVLFRIIANWPMMNRDSGLLLSVYIC